MTVHQYTEQINLDPTNFDYVGKILGDAINDDAISAEKYKQLIAVAKSFGFKMVSITINER